MVLRIIRNPSEIWKWQLISDSPNVVSGTNVTEKLSKTPCSFSLFSILLVSSAIFLPEKRLQNQNIHGSLGIPLLTWGIVCLLKACLLFQTSVIKDIASPPYKPCLVDWSKCCKCYFQQCFIIQIRRAGLKTCGRGMSSFSGKSSWHSPAWNFWLLISSLWQKSPFLHQPETQTAVGGSVLDTRHSRMETEASMFSHRAPKVLPGLFLPPHCCLWPPDCPFPPSSWRGCCWLMHSRRQHWAAWTSGGTRGSCCVDTYAEDCHRLLHTQHRSSPELSATCLHRLLHLQECLRGLLLPNSIMLCFLGLSYDIEFVLLLTGQGYR